MPNIKLKMYDSEILYFFTAEAAVVDYYAEILMFGKFGSDGNKYELENLEYLIIDGENIELSKNII